MSLDSLSWFRRIKLSSWLWVVLLSFIGICLLAVIWASHDADECNQYGICDQRCENTRDSHKCVCDAGYKLQNDRRTCRIIDGNAMMVLLILGRKDSSIWTYNFTSGKLSKIQKSDDDYEECRYMDYDGNFIYWSDFTVNGYSILRGNDGGSNVQSIVTPHYIFPVDFAVDWITHNIYFIQARHIIVCTSNGDTCRVLLTIGPAEEISLNPKKKYMYWISSFSNKTVIASAAMDGSNHSVLVDRAHPRSLAIDCHNDRIYWLNDGAPRRIETVKSDGSERRVIVKGKFLNYFSNPATRIAIFQDRVYWNGWTEIGKHNIQSCNKFTGSDHSVIIQNLGNVLGLRVSHSSMQRHTSNPCKNSTCSDICLLAPNPLGYSCSCHGDSTLTSDKHTCQSRPEGCSPVFHINHHPGPSATPRETASICLSNTTEFIIIGLEGNLFRIERKTSGKMISDSVHNNHHYGSVTYDSIKGKVIFYDINLQSVFSYTPEIIRSNIILKNGQVGNITDMDYDHLSGNVFWIDAKRQTLEVLSLITYQRAVLARDFGEDIPISLAVAPEKNAIFIAFHGKTAHIDRFHINGSTQTSFINADLKGPKVSLVYDESLRRIFWSDSGTGLIESIALDRSGRNQLMYQIRRVTKKKCVPKSLFLAITFSGLITSSTFVGPTKDPETPVNHRRWMLDSAVLTFIIIIMIHTVLLVLLSVKSE